MDSWLCYCLVSASGKTYVGVTLNAERRLRQHNRNLSGGARATGSDIGWKPLCFVLGFPDHRAVLQFEWKWKHLSRFSSGSSPTLRRLNALTKLLSDEKSTAGAEPYSSYPAPLLLETKTAESTAFFQGKTLPYAVISSESETSST